MILKINKRLYDNANLKKAIKEQKIILADDSNDLTPVEAIAKAVEKFPIDKSKK